MRSSNVINSITEYRRAGPMQRGRSRSPDSGTRINIPIPRRQPAQPSDIRRPRSPPLMSTPIESHHLVAHVTGSSARISMIGTCWTIAIWPSERPLGRQTQGSAHGVKFSNNVRPHRGVLQKTMQIGLEMRVRQIHPGKVPPIGPTTTR
jgi:hypothetical protein